MTEKEKAKAYDEAIKEAYIAYKDEDRHLKATLERIFPDLKEKESENERIRKEIIELLRNWASLHYISKEQFSERMAWLEKQGEQVSSQTNERAWLYLISDVPIPEAPEE